MACSTLQEVASVLALPFQEADNRLVTKFEVDSRAIQPDSLFFALKGAKTDGHLYLEEVARSGACGAVVSHSYKGPAYGLHLFPVADPLETLQTLAQKKVQERKARVVAITGSIGKTTTKDFTSTLLKEGFKKISSSYGNQNSQIGLPLTLLNQPLEQHEPIVLEMGMTHPGQISKLITIAPPEIAIITTITFAHACNFDSLAEIGQAKGEILSHPKTSLGIIPKDFEHFTDLAHRGVCKKISYSVQKEDGDFFMQILPEGLLVKQEGCRSSLLPKPNIPPHHWHNLLAAIVAARSLGCSWEEVQKGIPQCTLPERRFEYVEKEGVLFVNDSYNAIPAAVKAALANLPQPKPGGKIIAVLGEMLELGKFSQEAHYEVGQIALKYVDCMICFGSECQAIIESWRQANRPASLHMEFEEVVMDLKNQMKSGDVVLLKGSRAKGMWRILEAV